MSGSDEAGGGGGLPDRSCEEREKTLRSRPERGAGDRREEEELVRVVVGPLSAALTVIEGEGDPEEGDETAGTGAAAR